MDSGTHIKSDRTIIPIQKCIVIKFYFITYIKETLLIFGSKKLNIGKVFQFASLFHPLSQKYYYSRRILKNCRKGEPVYLTKNGRGRFVIMDIEDYERDRAEKKLLMKLQEAEEAVKDGEGWLDLDELKALVGE